MVELAKELVYRLDTVRKVGGCKRGAGKAKHQEVNSVGRLESGVRWVETKAAATEVSEKGLVRKEEKMVVAVSHQDISDVPPGSKTVEVKVAQQSIHRHLSCQGSKADAEGKSNDPVMPSVVLKRR